MPRQNKIADANWRIFFFFTGTSSQRFYTDMVMPAPDAITAVQRAEAKLDAMDMAMNWGQWAITGCKREDR